MSRGRTADAVAAGRRAGCGRRAGRGAAERPAPAGALPAASAARSLWLASLGSRLGCLELVGVGSGFGRSPARVRSSAGRRPVVEVVGRAARAAARGSARRRRAAARRAGRSRPRAGCGRTGRCRTSGPAGWSARIVSNRRQAVVGDVVVGAGGQAEEDVDQLVVGVVGELDRGPEPAGQAGVLGDEDRHRVGIAGDDQRPGRRAGPPSP